MRNNTYHKRLRRLFPVIAFSLFLITFCACKNVGNEDEVSSVEKYCTVGEQVVPQTMQSGNDDELLKKYSDLYNAKNVFQDTLNPTFYLLIGDSCVVGIQFAPGVEQSTVINYPVERIETSITEQICSLRLFDKTGVSITFMTTEDVCSKIFDMIE